MGGWNTMPGFCSWGLSPLPSSGVKASRANGFAANSITVTKNAATAHTTPATYGSSGAWRRDVNVRASEPNSDSTLAQKSRLPFWPAYSADQVLKIGRLRLGLAAA